MRFSIVSHCVLRVVLTAECPTTGLGDFHLVFLNPRLGICGAQPDWMTPTRDRVGAGFTEFRCRILGRWLGVLCLLCFAVLFFRRLGFGFFGLCLGGLSVWILLFDFIKIYRL